MKESARAGFSYIRSRSKEFGLEDDFHEQTDIHIHIPEGAIPKDGPSAGITMTTAVVSALLGVKVKSNLAMTGEITLRGRVLPVGGIKEKILAAHRAGITNILIPKENERDLIDIPDNIKRNLTIRAVETMDEVLEYALVDKAFKVM
jgi:ATP-dependent Lon protease